MAWREEYGTDSIIENIDFPEWAEVKKIYPRFYHKVDRIGRPVYVEQVGVVDFKKVRCCVFIWLFFFLFQNIKTNNTSKYSSSV